MIIGTIIQARLNSQRLPYKVVLPLPKDSGKPILKWVIGRAEKSNLAGNVIIVTPDNEIELLVYDWGIMCYRYDGPRDVLAEYWHAANMAKLDVVVRITADCPCIDPEEIDRLVSYHLDSDADYTFNRCDDKPNGWVDGMDIEIFNYTVLDIAKTKATTPYDREHVTPFIRKNFKIQEIYNPLVELDSSLKLSIDTVQDYLRISELFEQLPEGFTSEDIKKITTS